MCYMNHPASDMYDMSAVTYLAIIDNNAIDNIPWQLYLQYRTLVEPLCLHYIL